MRVRLVPLNDIHLDGDTQARAEISEGLVHAYAEILAVDQKTLPPMDVFFDGAEFWLAEGFHRWHAHNKADLTDGRCHVHTGTREEAQLFAMQANQTHGLRRSNADKRKAVEMAIVHPKLCSATDTVIAEHCGVDHKTVAKIRQELSAVPKTKVSSDGRNFKQPDPPGISQVLDPTDSQGRKWGDSYPDVCDASVLQDDVRSLKQMIREWNGRKRKKHNFAAKVDVVDLVAFLEAAKGMVGETIPASVCPKCEVAGSSSKCDMCDGTGWCSVGETDPSEGVGVDALLAVYRLLVARLQDEGFYGSMKDVPLSGLRKAIKKEEKVR